MNKFLIEVLQFALYVGLFYFITIPIFDFIAPDYVNRFDLAWSVSALLAIFVEKLYEIRELLDKINKKNE
jgi:hypothetical protein